MITWVLLGVHFVAENVRAFPSFRQRFPNAFRVACPPSQTCDADPDANQAVFARNPSGYCNGVGHNTCAGGVSGAANAPDLNSFGVDFAANSYKWTRALCEKDSDLDGFTNGEELGDPCCVWLESYGEEELSDYTRMFDATHPGFADSKPPSSSNSADFVRKPALLPADPTNVTACATTLPKSAGGTPMVLSQFNPGEDEKEVRLFINSFPVPSAERTTYVDFAFNVPEFADSPEEILYVIGGEAIVENPAVLHHFVVVGCSQKWPDAVGNGGVVSRSDAVRNCRTQWGGWAPGKSIVATPSWAGKAVGRGAGVVAFAVNVHYDNPQLTTGIFSSDGISLRYTPTPQQRPYLLDTFQTLQLSRTPALTIPKNEPRWFLTRRCRVRLADEVATKGGWNVFSVSHHAHLLGREMYIELYKKTSPAFSDPTATGRMLANDRIWHFDDQYQFFIQKDGSTSNATGLPSADSPMGSPLKPTLTLHTGDILQSTCVFDSTARSAATMFDKETTDEMCWASFLGWSNIPKDAPDQETPIFCEGVAGDEMNTGHIYMGRLSQNELAAGIGKTKHTEATNTISSVLSGTVLVSGGYPVKVVGGEDGQRCQDENRLCATVILTNLTQRLQTTAADDVCTEDLSRVVPMLSGYNAIGMCCQTACTQLCPSYAGCPGAESTSATRKHNIGVLIAAVISVYYVVALAHF